MIKFNSKNCKNGTRTAVINGYKHDYFGSSFGGIANPMTFYVTTSVSGTIKCLTKVAI